MPTDPISAGIILYIIIGHFSHLYLMKVSEPEHIAISCLNIASTSAVEAHHCLPSLYIIVQILVHAT